MAATLFNRYIWLVDTILSAGNISLEEINRRWQYSQYNDKHEREIPDRTFHRHKEAIQSMFGIEIRCNRADSTYYIANADDLERGSVRTWLLNTFAVNRLINESRQIKQRILFEEIPSGQRFLTQIIEAMREGHTMEITYQSFWKEAASTFEVEPYCVKVFRQRWYVVARSTSDTQLRIYSLDRIHELRTTENNFVIPEDFDPQTYFADSFGIAVDEDYDVESVRFKVSGVQRQYIRTLPLHASLRETEITDNYSIFEVRLRPTLDFQQALLSNAANTDGQIEVLQPAWLRDKMRQIGLNLYNSHNTNQQAARFTPREE